MASVQWINSWWWAEELPETCRVSCQNKLVKLVHLVGFIIKKLLPLTVFGGVKVWWGTRIVKVSISYRLRHNDRHYTYPWQRVCTWSIHSRNSAWAIVGRPSGNAVKFKCNQKLRALYRNRLKWLRIADYKDEPDAHSVATNLPWSRWPCRGHGYLLVAMLISTVGP